MKLAHWIKALHKVVYPFYNFNILFIITMTWLSTMTVFTYFYSFFLHYNSSLLCQKYSMTLQKCQKQQNCKVRAK